MKKPPVRQAPAAHFGGNQARWKVIPHFFWIEAASMACICPLRLASSAVFALSPPTRKAAGQKMTTAAVVATASLVR